MAQGKQNADDSDIELQRLVRRYDLAKVVLAPAVWLAALWIPLQGALPIAQELAGKDTSLVLSFSITLVISLAAGSGTIALLIRSRQQRKEIVRLRDRCKTLEHELELNAV